MSFERAKRRRQARLATAKPQLPAYIDLIQWVKIRSNLSTRRAMSVIMAGALKVDSHTIGVKQTNRIDGTSFSYIERYVPADLRGRIEIVTPEGL